MIEKEPILLEEFKARELEVLGLIADGLSNKEIADKLFIAVSTVRWHNKQIYSKLGVHSRTLAVAQARDLGLLDAKPHSDNISKQLPQLPQKSSSFIGREREIATAQSLLGHTRLLTLTGPGGSGKTRLALKIAHHIKDDYADGVYFVSLASVQDAGLVSAAIARSLNIKEKRNEAIEVTLCKELRDKQTLLVVDNFEHVMSAMSLISALLQDTKHLRIIITSREVLRIYGEQEYPIPPLTLPILDHHYKLETIASVEAMQLFAERAQAVKADFAITDDNVRDIAKICIYLDGLPLAIELVASHIKMLSPAQIVGRLAEGFDLLARGLRDAPARQRTLNATIDWSYNLLTAEEQDLFLQLSVFTGGFTLDAAEAICQSDNHFDMIASLLDQSLLRYEENERDEPRFFMLETIRQYANNKFSLQATENNYATLMTRFATYFADFAEYAEPRSFRKQKTYWLNRIKSEMDNLLATMRWSLSDTGDLSLGLRVFARLGSFWYLRVNIVEERWDEKLLADADTVAQEILPAAYNTAARIKRNIGEDDTAIQLYEQSIEISTQVEDVFNLATATSNQSMLLVWQGRLGYEAAQKRFEDCVALFEQIDDTKGIADTTNKMGELARYFGDYERAYTFYQAAGDLSEETDRLEFYAHQQNLAFVDLRLGQVAEAKEKFAIIMRDHDKIIVPYVMFCLAGFVGVLVAESEYQSAACLIGGLEANLKSARVALHLLEQRDYDEFVQACRAQMADDIFNTCYEEGAQKPLDELVACALERFTI